MAQGESWKYVFTCSVCTAAGTGVGSAVFHQGDLKRAFGVAVITLLLGVAGFGVCKLRDDSRNESHPG